MLLLEKNKFGRSKYSNSKTLNEPFNLPFENLVKSYLTNHFIISGNPFSTFSTAMNGYSNYQNSKRMIISPKKLNAKSFHLSTRTTTKCLRFQDQVRISIHLKF